MDIHFRNLLQISDEIRRREITSLTVTETLLDRIAEHDSRLHSITAVLADTAREQASQADREIDAGQWRGPLHGVPIGIKDVFWTKGSPTAAGTTFLADFSAPCDATIVERLKCAGAVLIAKTSLTEASTLVHHPALRRPVNPWSIDHWTGVSSSGSGVATAAGLCFGAIGTDTGGSIRFPCAATNLTGIKPTWGRVSRHGLIHNNESLDHIGPMARSTADAAAILQVIAGRDSRDPTTLTAHVPNYLESVACGVEGIRLGVDWRFVTEGVDSEINIAFKEAIDTFISLGCRIQEIEIPWGDDTFAKWTAMYAAETAVSHEPYFLTNEQHYGPYLKEALHRAKQLNPLDVSRSYQARDIYKGQFEELFQNVDLIITPGMGRILPTCDIMETLYGRASPYLMDLLRFTVPFNVVGVPTISLPGGFTPDRLPIGIQLIAPWLSEATLIRAGGAFQRVTAFHTCHPKLDS